MKKFSVRDLFFVVTIAAILCGWWYDHRREKERQEKQNELYRYSISTLGSRAEDAEQNAQTYYGFYRYVKIEARELRRAADAKAPAKMP